MVREITITVEIPVYEVTLEDGTKVRFHDYETEDGGLRIRYEKIGKYGFPDRRGSERKRSARPDPTTTTYRDALVPFAELDGQCVSPIRVGTITHKRDYKYERQVDDGLIFTSYRYTWTATSDTYVEYDETLITTKVGS